MKDKLKARMLLATVGNKYTATETGERFYSETEVLLILELQRELVEKEIKKRLKNENI